MELETIIFGSSFDVDPDMVRYCLPRVPKLREVSLHWNESLSAPLLRDSIGHLERITILNTSYITFDDEMAEDLFGFDLAPVTYINYNWYFIKDCNKIFATITPCFYVLRVLTSSWKLWRKKKQDPDTPCKYEINR
ncbi:unnamed protein product [Allacma fusca]|uniref:Uncharacterized protein n=1 Tax=Allacma fusca TaxID=39272 RepID=A0A8J2KFR1_9HEXA|nr:unnamed protein product [Allacma fusca]